MKSFHATTPSKIVVHDDSKAKLMKKYSEMGSKKIILVVLRVLGIH